MTSMDEPTFLRACRKQDAAHTPIWMMRQAGRTIPAYRELRDRYGFLDVVKHADLMADVTLMPMREMPLDAAVMFADIMLPLSALGVKFEIVDGVGPIIREPIRTVGQIQAFLDTPVRGAIPQVFDAIRIVRRELTGRDAALIGFSGAPFTLASYLVEGRPSRDYTETKRLMFSEPATWHLMMSRLTSLVVEYLREQVEAGIQAWQLFDSWIGALAPQDVQTYVLPYSAQIFAAVAEVPRIHFGTNTASMLELMAEAGPDVVSVDWRVPLDKAWARIGDCGIQGNLEPAVLLGPPDLIQQRAGDVLRQAAARPGHVFNLGHGVLPESPLDNLKLLVDFVQGWTR